MEREHCFACTFWLYRPTLQRKIASFSWDASSRRQTRLLLCNIRASFRLLTTGRTALPPIARGYPGLTCYAQDIPRLSPAPPCLPSSPTPSIPVSTPSAPPSPP